MRRPAVQFLLMLWPALTLAQDVIQVWEPVDGGFRTISQRESPFRVVEGFVPSAPTGIFSFTDSDAPQTQLTLQAVSPGNVPGSIAEPVPSFEEPLIANTVTWAGIQVEHFGSTLVARGFYIITWNGPMTVEEDGGRVTLSLQGRRVWELYPCTHAIQRKLECVNPVLSLPAVAVTTHRISAVPFAGIRHLSIALDSEVFGVFEHGSLWLWNPRTFGREQHYSSGPAGRYRPGLAWDSTRKRVVMFGGQGLNGVLLNDTWEWDGTRWYHMTGSAPPARHSHQLAYDPIRKRTVLFGGHGPGNDPDVYADTWEWNGSSWSNKTPVTSPIRRDAAGLSWDGNLNEVLLFGGWDGFGPMNDTWSWNGQRWLQHTPSSPPPARSSQSMAWDPVRHTVVMAGALHPGQPTTAEWDGAEWRPLGELDVARSAVVHQPGFGTYVLLNGDVWRLDGDEWVVVPEPVIAPRAGAVSEDGGAVLFTEDGDRFDWSNGNWAWRAASPFAPTAVARSGGRVYGSANGALWAWADGGWNEVTPAPPVVLATAADDTLWAIDNASHTAWTLDGEELTAAPWPAQPDVAHAVPRPDGGFWVLGLEGFGTVADGEWHALIPRTQFAAVPHGPLLAFDESEPWTFDYSAWPAPVLSRTMGRPMALAEDGGWRVAMSLLPPIWDALQPLTPAGRTAHCAKLFVEKSDHGRTLAFDFKRSDDASCARHEQCLGGECRYGQCAQALCNGARCPPCTVATWPPLPPLPPDAGPPPPRPHADVSYLPGDDAGADEDEGYDGGDDGDAEVPQGCGCSSVEVSVAWLLLLALRRARGRNIRTPGGASPSPTAATLHDVRTAAARVMSNQYRSIRASGEATARHDVRASAARVNSHLHRSTRASGEATASHDVRATTATRLLFPLLTVLVLTSCRDDDPTRAYGELLFVQGDALLTDAVFTSPPAFMTEAMEGEVLVRNVGRVAAEIEAVTREGDTAFTLLDAEGMSFSSGAELPLRFRFAPPQAGDATAASVAHEAVFTLTLTGTAEDKSQLTLTLRADALARDCYVPALLNFGRVPTGHTVTAQVTLENGAALPSPTTWNNATTVFALPPPPLEVAAGSSAQLAVSFTPTSEGSFEETVTVSRGATCPEAQLQLTGVGDDEAITWSPSSLRFGRVPRGERKVMEVVFTNHSTVTLEVTASVSGDAFSLDDAPAAISGEGSAAVRVACQPDNLGNTTGTLTVNFGFTPPFIATVPLTCVGGGPRIRVTPGVFTFGQVPFNATGTAVTRRRLMVQNVGTAPEAPGDTQHNLRLGQSGALPWFAVVPRNAHTRLTEFEVGLVSSYDVAAGIPALPGENLVEFEVRLKPTTAEPREADLLVYSNDEIEPVLRIPLTAAPRAPEPCAIEVSDETVNFGPTPRGALVTRTVTLTNTSAVAGNQCLISGIELAPGSDLAFSVLEPANGALLIPSSQARTITVQADVPADAEYGDYLRGTLRFAVGNDGTLRTLPVAAQVSHCLLVDPPVLNLGVVQESCTSAPKPVTLYNLCSVPITVAPPAVPAPFIASTSPFTGPLTMAPGTTASMELSLAPVSAAQHQAVLTFTATQAGEVATAHVVLRAQSTVDGLQSDAFNQDAAAVDILFVIDDSCSMGDEQAKLASNFASFISAATQGTGDWRIAVTTTDLYAQQGRFYGNPRVLTPLTPNVAAAFANNVSVGTSGAGYEQPFACMGAALTSELLATHNAGFLRENAALAVVIVTDAVESSTGPVASYVAAVRAAKNNTPELVTVSVVGPFSPSGNGCSVEGVDDGRYAAIVQATGGTQADICATNWATSLAGVSQAVFGSRRIFTLSGTPNSANDITVTVDSAPVTTGWQWDHVRNAIVFEVPPTAGSELSISYLTACF